MYRLPLLISKLSLYLDQYLLYSITINLNDSGNLLII